MHTDLKYQVRGFSMEILAVKFKDEEAGIIEGLAIPYGGPWKGKDLDGEYFSKDTDFLLGWYKERPLIIDHGLDGVVGPQMVGKQVKAVETESGIWVEAVLDKSAKYWEQVKNLVDKGILYFSSGAMPHLVKKEASGHIKRWPWVELSVTPTPSNPYAVSASKNIQNMAALLAANGVKASFNDEMLERFVKMEIMGYDLSARLYEAEKQVKDLEDERKYTQEAMNSIFNRLYDMEGKMGHDDERKSGNIPDPAKETPDPEVEPEPKDDTELAAQKAIWESAEYEYYKSLVEV